MPGVKKSPKSHASRWGLIASRLPITKLQPLSLRLQNLFVKCSYYAGVAGVRVPSRPLILLLGIIVLVGFGLTLALGDGAIVPVNNCGVPPITPAPQDLGIVDIPSVGEVPPAEPRRSGSFCRLATDPEYTRCYTNARLAERDKYVLQERLFHRWYLTHEYERHGMEVRGLVKQRMYPVSPDDDKATADAWARFYSYRRAARFQVMFNNRIDTSS